MRRYQPQHLAPRPARPASRRRLRRLGVAASVVLAAPGIGSHNQVAQAGGPVTGTVAALGEAANYGSATGQAVAGMARTPSGKGYWLVTTGGRVFAFGDAPALGEPAATLNRRADQPIVDIASTPDGAGYWLVASDGRVFAFGTAADHGSAGSAINAPVVGITSSPSGQGYWLVARDGGVFAYGDAHFLGSAAGAMALNHPLTGIAATPTGAGYWLVGRDGGVFTFGDAAYLGSAGDRRLNEPIVGIAGTATGAGYWLVARDGGVFTFGDAGFHGSLATTSGRSGAPVVDIAGTPGGNGQWLANGGRYLGDFVVTCYALRGITASGQRVRPGVVAVDPRVVPLGTELYVGGEGTMTALDTGGNIKGRRLDIWRRTNAECRAFGRQTLPVFAPGE